MVENRIRDFLYFPILPTLGSSLIWFNGSNFSPCWMLEDVRSDDVLLLSKIRRLQVCVWENLTMVRHGES